MNHYVYRITNISENRHYYGVRSCKCDPRKDIGFDYFSSSKDKQFLKDQKENPHHYKYKIVRIFESRQRAIKFEIKLHTKFNVGTNESFYNRSKQTSLGFDTAGSKMPNISAAAKERFKNPDNHPRGMLGKTHTEESNQKRREKILGLKRSEQTKMKYREVALRRVWATVTCPHCETQGKENAMLRWHFDNCKQMKESEDYTCESCT